VLACRCGAANRGGDKATAGVYVNVT
jgi:hypothetical protein